MYEVFSYGKRITIGDACQNEGYTSGGNSIEATELKQIKARLFDYLTSAETETLHLDYSSGKLWPYFQSWFKTILAAGGVVQSDRGMLFIFKNEKWDLPKGKVEFGESLESAAVREVEEETGAKGVSVVQPLSNTWHIFIDYDGQYILKQTAWFLMKTTLNTTLQPDPQENIEQVVWIARNEVPLIADAAWPNLRSVIHEALEVY